MSNCRRKLRNHIPISEYVSSVIKKADDLEQNAEQITTAQINRAENVSGGICDAGDSTAAAANAADTNDQAEDDDEEVSRVVFRSKPAPINVSHHYRSLVPDDELGTPHPDDLLSAQFEHYGSTPPRTRMKIKNRDWERKQKSQNVVNVSAEVSGGDNGSQAAVTPRKGMTRMARSRVNRRNTMDCALLHEMFVNDNRSDKRAQAKIREAERDLKNSMASIVPIPAGSYQSRGMSFHENSHSNLESSDKCMPLGTEVIMRNTPKVESCNRYMSVSSLPIGSRASAPPSAFVSQLRIDGKRMPGLKKRKEFHETFANLIKLGSVDRQEAKLSHEEQTWQTELKDLIWLELQAWQADRTMEQQDKYLFAARQGVHDLLMQILNYKFQPRYKRESSEISMDSGISADEASNSSCCQASYCNGCMSLYCKDCVEQQQFALNEVEELLTRLDAAEALYPSSKNMGEFHPIYKSEGFVGRIKAMCLWYNITKQHQLKLSILGKILARLQGSKFSWPVQTSVTTAHDSGSSSSSVLENDDSGINSIDSTKTVNSNSSSSRKSSSGVAVPKVQFLLNDVQHEAGETNSSTDESTTTEVSQLHELSPAPFRKNSMHDINIFSVEPLENGNDSNAEHSSALYRKFIENVLKSRGLAKSLAFLHKLHTIKAHISLEKPGTEDYDFETEIIDEDLPRLEPEVSREQIDELRRYGYWSEEAKSLNLPTYIPTFVFLSGIPLQFLHEFLRLRLETRPAKPNPLSLEQLMMELREGLTLALTHRERYQRHVTTALMDNEAWERYMGILNQYDATVRKVFELYLDYIYQLVLVAAPETHQKSALEKEWMFTKLVSPMISGMHTLAAGKFCEIIRKLLKNISERLVSRAEELDVQIDAHKMETELKWQMLTICREMQLLFTVERERSVKLLFFAKTFCRDVETADFHREHFEQDVATHNGHEPLDFMCSDVKQSFKLLQQNVLDVRNKLTKIIERVQERSNSANLMLLDEQDRHAVLSRTKEILHQGYKFGFEYNKDVIRLFEQRVMLKSGDCGTSVGCEADLSKGIVAFAQTWMQFVTERCERGRGVRPRWASQGLEFLILACDPQITRHLDEHEFEQLKHQMDRCISHVVGKCSVEPEKKLPAHKKASPRTRKTSSPATSRSRTPTRQLGSGLYTSNTTPVTSPQFNKFLHPQFSLKEEILTQGCAATKSEDTTDFELSYSPKVVTGELRLIVPNPMTTSTDSTPSTAATTASVGSNSSLALRQIRVRDAVNRLDLEIEEKLRERNLIGNVKALNSCDKIQIRARSVNFRWHRGIKLGQGRFGKVYTAVNNNTGELMAMKEIAIQPGETRALKNVAEELKILEGIKHLNLVRYYGIEVRREELLIFMELCSEGTLEAFVELSGELPEGLTRRFTSQLLSGVAELHKHGIVHRDIKTANIFLVDGSNCLKLGDFGSAVKIQAHTTVPGELQGLVGTQAYMAPEVFMKTNSDGHGRAADIWSVGCVVVEMASGKRPWAQFDLNYQIMFKVGMGEKPEAPESLSQEGHDFVDYCLQHDPKMRRTAVELLQHNFCKYGSATCLNAEHVQEQVRRSFRRTPILK